MKKLQIKHTKKARAISLLSVIGGFALLFIFLGSAQFSAEATSGRQTTPTIQWSTATISQPEQSTDQVLNLTLQISPVPTGTNVVTVTYATGNGTALSGIDYETATGVITFSAGSGATATVPITILADSSSEAAENFFVQLKNPVNAVLGTNSVVVVNIPANGPTATPTRTPTIAATQVYIDSYEGNETLQTAYTLDGVPAGDCIVEDATFWPAGDTDFYRFWAKANVEYTIAVDAATLSPGLDTFMTLYNPEGGQITQNDETSAGAATSTITFTPSRDAWHFFSLLNEDPSNPAGKEYCVKISEAFATPTPTATATFALPSTVTNDTCATSIGFPDNDIPEYACVISIGTESNPSPDSSVKRDFVPRAPDVRDIDFYRVWVRANNFYQCDTLELSEFNDTNLKFVTADQDLIAENNDFNSTTSGSQLSWYATYTGWMYIFVEPKVPVEYRIANRYDYVLNCSTSAATPTPLPTATRVPSTGTGSGGGSEVVTPPTAVPTVPPTQVVAPVVTIDVLATVQAATTPTPPPTPRPNVSINPLPTDIPPVTPFYGADLQIVLFYDLNQNNLPEINEGIVDMAVLAKDGGTGQLLALGYTNEAGLLRFEVAPSAESLIISIPYLGIEQTISVAASELLIRVAPSSLPASLP